MTRIEFLHDAPDRLAAAAAWLRNASRKRRQVLVFTPEPHVTDQLDRALWAQPATGFIPHCRANSPLAAETPIILVESLAEIPRDDCLLNLSNELPTGFARFEEVVEIVSTSDADRLPARERFKFYRERGYEIKAQNIAEGIRDE